MQRSTKIAWTIVALLVGGIVLYNLDTPTMTGRVGILIATVVIVAIAGIWRWKAEKKVNNK